MNASDEETESEEETEKEKNAMLRSAEIVRKYRAVVYDGPTNRNLFQYSAAKEARDAVEFAASRC
jgi:hypothetical protein